MNKATMKWRLALPVAAAVLALGGCGGSSDNSTDAVVSSSGSITACFTANDVVNFAVEFSGPSSQIPATRSVAGPMIYNGQVVSGQKLFYPNGNITYTQSNYWTVTSSGVTMIASVDYNGVATTDDMFLPQNMNFEQTAVNSTNDVDTFVGFESITLAGKIFANTCHIRQVDSSGAQADSWYAPGYGMIKDSVSSGVTWQYNGDL